MSLYLCAAVYQDLQDYVRSLGVKQPIIGTADHGHSGPPWAMLTSLSKLDIVDGHIYWNSYVGVGNVPMVNDPLHSTIVQVARTAFAGKPYTVSETDEPFPSDWNSEYMPILAAYAGFQDWDMCIIYTFEPKKDPNWQPYVGDAWDISLDPIRMTGMAAGALMFLQFDVKPARQVIERTYSKEQVLDAGLVTVDTDRSQALIGFIKANKKTLKNLSADITNNFATIVLTSMDSKPIASSGKMLLNASSRMSNTDQKWADDAHTALAGGRGARGAAPPPAGSCPSVRRSPPGT